MSSQILNQFSDLKRFYQLSLEFNRFCHAKTQILVLYIQIKHQAFERCEINLSIKRLGLIYEDKQIYVYN